MLRICIKALIRIRFFLTSRDRACDQITRAFEEYQLLGNEISSTQGRQPFRVPTMRGVDEDMRDWSFFMILEHNIIVNSVMEKIVESLASHTIPEDLPVKDSKKDVMPSHDSGPEQMTAFCQSVQQYLQNTKKLESLRGTPRYRHPVFGMLNAHGWHCMMALHLEIHLPQAKCVLEGLHAEG